MTESTPEPGIASRRPGSGRLLIVVVGIGLAGALAWWGRGWLTAAVGTVGQASPVWLLLAVAAKAVSMTGLAGGQRRIIARGSAHRLGLRSVLATAYAGNTISTALPLAGAGMSAAFTYRRYVTSGVPSAQAATGLAVSWAVASATLTAVLSAAAVGTGRLGLLFTGLLGGLASVAVVTGLLLALQSVRGRSWAAAVATPVLGVVQRVTHRFTHRAAGDPAQLVRAALAELTATRLRPRDIALGAGAALLLWGGDIACIGFALAAVGGSLSPPLLILAWSAGVAATTFSVTPGGLGLVEAALGAALIAAGIPATTALAAVLLYRLVSFWLVAAIGALILAADRHRPA